MPSHYCEEYDLVVGTPCYPLAELNVTMFWPWVLKFSVQPNRMTSLTCYIWFYKICYIAEFIDHIPYAECCVLSKFRPKASPVFSGMLDFNSSSRLIDTSCSLSQSFPTSLNRRSHMLHFKPSSRQGDELQWDCHWGPRLGLCHATENLEQPFEIYYWWAPPGNHRFTCNM